MKVLINCWFGHMLKTGVRFYADQLVKHLSQFAPEVEVLRFRPPLEKFATRLFASRREINRNGRSGARPLRRPHFRFRPIIRKAWRRARDLRFQWICQRDSLDLYHEPNYIPLDYDGPIVTTVHDMSALLYPQWHPKDRANYFERHFYKGVRVTDQFTADSEFTRREMLAHLDVGPERVHVVHLAARSNFVPLPPEVYLPIVRRLQLPQRYLLFVGTLEPRKNLLTLLRAYRALPDSVRSGHPLVLVGQPGWGIQQEVEQELNRLGDSVRWLGYVPERYMAAVFNSATVLVYPSLYEGFGLPPLEMMACGRPVIASNCSALPEVIGEGGILVAPQDVDAISGAIRAVITNPGFAAEMGQRGLKSARRFCWTNTAAQTLAVYHRAVGSELASLLQAA